MLIAKIVNITKETLRENNSIFLDVEFEILKKDKKGKSEVITARKLAFPFDIPKEEITEELRKYTDTFAHDLELAEQSKKVEEAHQKADKTISHLIGQEI
jgi:hypothetical protein